MSVFDYKIQHSFHWIQQVNFISGLFTKTLIGVIGLTTMTQSIKNMAF